MNNSDEQSKATQTDVTPIAIDRDGDTAIEIKWSDQTVNHWTVAALRKACPCATSVSYTHLTLPTILLV